MSHLHTKDDDWSWGGSPHEIISRNYEYTSELEEENDALKKEVKRLKKIIKKLGGDVNERGRTE